MYRYNTPIIENNIICHVRRKKKTQCLLDSEQKCAPVVSAAGVQRRAQTILATEELSEFFHTPLHQVLLAEVVTQGHVGQFRLLFLYLKQARFDRILDN